MAPATEERVREIEALEQELVEKHEKLAEMKRELPPQEVPDYTLQTQKGPVKLSDLFNGKPDLIVMGTHGRSPLGTFVLGSVANGVLGNCKIPVLLIR